MPLRKLLVVDDDQSIYDSLALSFTLQGRSFDLSHACNGKDALSRFEAEQPDIVLLDLGLPLLGGFEVLKQIRAVSQTPVIILSARHGEMDVVRALQVGADDYITKPFGLMELLARIDVQARRLETVPQSQETPQHFNNGGLTVDFLTKTVRIRGNVVALTHTEFRLLASLVKNADRLMPTKVLLRLVWGSDYYEGDVLRVYVSRLRRKLQAVDPGTDHIITKAGIGYTFHLMKERAAL